MRFTKEFEQMQKKRLTTKGNSLWRRSRIGFLSRLTTDIDEGFKLSECVLFG